MRNLSSYIALFRPGIALFAACSAVTGFLLAAHHPTSAALLPFLGVFLLACGASGLNQVQERRTDALMERTKNRPLPAGRISPLHAAAVSLIAIAAGSLLLVRMGNLAPMLGLGALLWYNGLYTPLKTRTAFAAVPGALVGAAPPAIGWTAAGGNVTSPGLFALAAFFFLWQVPHFWLLVLEHGHEYEKAGLPTLKRSFTERQIARLVLFWTSAAAASVLAFPLFGLAQRSAFPFLLLPGMLLLPAIGMTVFRSGRAPAYRAAFRAINAYLLLILLGLAAAAFLS